MGKTDGGRWGTCEWGEEEVRLGVNGEGLEWGGWVDGGYHARAAHAEWLVWGRRRRRRRRGRLVKCVYVWFKRET